MGATRVVNFEMSWSVVLLSTMSRVARVEPSLTSMLWKVERKVLHYKILDPTLFIRGYPT